MRLEVENLTYLSKKKESLYTLPGLVIGLPLAVMEEYSIQLHSLGGGGQSLQRIRIPPLPPLCIPGMSQSRRRDRSTDRGGACP